MTKKELYRVDIDFTFVADRVEAWFFRRGTMEKHFVLDRHRYNRLLQLLRAAEIDPVGYASAGRFGIVYEAG